MPTAHRICKAEELPPGERRIVEVSGKSIGVFNIDGSYHAIRNVCPHQMAPLCLGRLSGTTLPSEPGEFNYGLEGRVIRCPWHGWEFDVTTGRSVFNPHKMRVKHYEVTVEAAEAGRPADSPAAVADCPTQTLAADGDDPSVETFEVSVEEAWVVLNV